MRLAILGLVLAWACQGGAVQAQAPSSGITSDKGSQSGIQSGLSSGTSGGIVGWGVLPATTVGDTVKGQIASGAPDTPWGQYAPTGFQYAPPAAPPTATASPLWKMPPVVHFRNSGRVQ